MLLLVCLLLDAFGSVYNMKCWPLEMSSIWESHDPCLWTGIVTVGVLTQDWALR